MHAHFHSFKSLHARAAGLLSKNIEPRSDGGQSRLTTYGVTSYKAKKIIDLVHGISHLMHVSG